MCNCKNCVNFKEKEMSAFEKWYESDDCIKHYNGFATLALEKATWNAAIDAVLSLDAPFLTMPKDLDAFMGYINQRNELIKKLKED